MNEIFRVRPIAVMQPLPDSGTEHLTPADKVYLKFLRRQVYRLEQIRFTQDATSNTNNELFQAREELRKFVEGKRRQGYLV